jgi:peroxiredoxin
MHRGRLAGVIWLALLGPLALGGTFNPDRTISDIVPAWQDLPGVDGKRHGWDAVADREFVVVVFTCNSCPYAVDYEERVEALARQAAAADSRFAVVAINSNRIPEDSLPAMRERAHKKKFSFPYLFDESQSVARSFGAVRTPEFFILDRDRRIVYMGAMDDNADPGRVTKTYLADALAALQEGRPAPVTETAPVGCMIRFVRNTTRNR